MNTPRRFRHVIWDWNGTLLDDAWLSILTVNQLLEERGLEPVSPERYRRIFGFPLTDYYRKLGFETVGAPFRELCLRFYELYQAREQECALQRGARQLLLGLRERGVTQSILSAYEHRSLQRVVQHHELLHFFEDVLGHDGPEAGTKFESARRWLAASGLDGRDVLYVGDTLHDAEVAREIGADGVLLASGHQEIERLLEGGVPVLHSLEELPALIG